MDMNGRKQYLEKLGEEYRRGSKRQKTWLLNEVTISARKWVWHPVTAASLQVESLRIDQRDFQPVVAAVELQVLR